MIRRFVAFSVLLVLVLVLLVSACSSGNSVSTVASSPRPTPTPPLIIPGLVPDPSPTPVLVPTVAAAAVQPTATPAQPTPTATAADDEDETDAESALTPTPVAKPTSTPRPASTVTPTAVEVSSTATPTGPAATPVSGLEVSCTISKSNIVVEEVVTMKAFQNPPNVPVVFNFDHGDGTGDQTAESLGFYRAAGQYRVVLNWETAEQRGSTLCGTVVVTDTAGPPPPSTGSTVEIGCNVSARDIFLGERATLEATQSPANVTVDFVFEHGDGTLDPTDRSEAYYQSVGVYTVRLRWAHSGQTGVVECGTVNVAPVADLNGYVGLAGAQAEVRAVGDGLIYRLARLDDAIYPAPLDFRPDRINIEIDANLVSKATLG